MLLIISGDISTVSNKSTKSKTWRLSNSVVFDDSSDSFDCSDQTATLLESLKSPEPMVKTPNEDLTQDYDLREGSEGFSKSSANSGVNSSGAETRRDSRSILSEKRLTSEISSDINLSKNRKRSLYHQENSDISDKGNLKSLLE